MLASLNHPNVATLYGFEEATALPATSSDAAPTRQRFLVMEVVEGETLAERLKGGPLPLAECLEVFIQIAHGLEAAHEKGIVHRDLKPANIKFGAGDRIKILDFGLAKAVLGSTSGAAPGAISGSSPDPTESPTLAHGATQRGDAPRHRRLHEPGAGARRRGRQAHRRVGVRLLSLRVAHRTARVRRRLGGRHPRRGAARGARLERDRGPRAGAARTAAAPLSREEGAAATARRRRRRARARGPAAKPGLRRGDGRGRWTRSTESTAGSAPRRGRGGDRPADRARAPASRFAARRRARPPARCADSPRRCPPLAARRSTRWRSPTTGASSRSHRPIPGRPLWFRRLDQTSLETLAGTEQGEFPFFSPDGEWLAFFTGFENALKKMPTSGGGQVVTLGRRSQAQLGRKLGTPTARSCSTVRAAARVCRASRRWAGPPRC